ncbi:MAG: UbiA family prenyltransferase [bacterium]
MKGALRLVRASDWWLYHLLPLMAAVYASIAYFAVPPRAAYPALARLLASIICIAAYSHVVNDIGDADQDAAAGKPQRWRGISLGGRAAVAIALLVAGLAVWIGAAISAWTAVLLIVIAALQPIYVLPPLRMKERGVWGIVVDSLHTHALPTLFCVAVFADAMRASVWRPFPMALTVWSFLVGVRGIIYHQRIDEANDRCAGVNTFVTAHGSEAAGTLARRLVFPAELAALGAVAVSLYGTAPVVVIVFAVYALVMQVLRRANIWQATFNDPAPATRDAYIPLLAFYRSWPAFAFAIVLVVNDHRFVPLLLLHSVIFAAPILRQAEDLRLYLWFYGQSVASRVWHRFTASGGP